MRVLALIALAACASPRGLEGTTGAEDATLHLEVPVRLWSGSDRVPVTIGPRAVRAHGTLVLEAIGDACSPALDMFAEPGAVYRIRSAECKLSCSRFQLAPDGASSEGYCHHTPYPSLAARKQKREEIVEKRRPTEWPHPAMRLGKLFDAWGVETTTLGDSIWLREVRAASTGAEAGLRKGDRLLRIGYVSYYSDWSSHDLRGDDLERIWVMHRRPVVLIVKRGDQRARVVLNRSRRLRR